MEVLRYNINTKEYMSMIYPHRKGISQPLIGLDSNIRFYIPVENTKPDFDSRLEKLEPVYNFTETKHEEYDHIYICNVDWNITKVELLTLDKYKSYHRQKLTDTIIEVSGLIRSAIDVYDPLGINIPEDLKTLIATTSPLRSRGLQEIDSLTTPEEAVKYVVRGPEIELLINQIKQFL